MILNVMRKVTLVALLAVPATVVAAGCDSASSIAEGLCCTDFRPGADLNSVKWGLDGQSEVEFKAFMQASADFSAAASSIVSDLSVDCQELAVDLGASDGDITEQDPGSRAEQWCGKAADLLKAKLSGAGVTIVAQPPVCTVNASAKASCEAQCSADASCQLQPGELPTCSGGELPSFTCEGQCTGSCSGSADLAVSCSGTCSGTCEGKCDAKDSTGSCAGTCEGQCRGTCQATGNVAVQCEGQCTGTCDVAFKAPRCSGGVEPKVGCSANAQCTGSCDASFQAKAECQPGSVMINATGALDARTRAALEGSVPRLRALLDGRVKLLAGSVNTLVSLSASIPSTVTASAKATGCLATAVAPALGNASLQLAAATRASVKLSASLGQ